MLKGKNAVLTGSRRGIGRAIVEMFASNGANIWACARKRDIEFEQDMADLADKYGVLIWPVYFDVTEENEVKTAVQMIKKQKESVDILVNNAGSVEDSTSFFMTKIDKMKQVFDVNFWGTTILTQYISRIMARQNCGSIVNIASIAGIDGEPAQYEYATSKAAIIGATKHLARELAPNGIRVNAVAPGMISTDMGNQIDDELKQSILSKVIMNRMGKPEEIASVVAFLSSDMASYMTGQIVRVDGGI